MLGGVVGLWRALVEVDPQAIALQSIQRVNLGIVGRPGVGKRTLRAALAGGGDASAIAIVELNGDVAGPPPAAHAALVVFDASVEPTAAELAAARQIERRIPTLVVLNRADAAADPESRRLAVADELGLPVDRVVPAVAIDGRNLDRGLIPRLATLLDTRALAMARSLPGTRDAVARALIFDASKRNAQFALLSSVPANLPVIGTLASFGADTLMLTKNQALLIFKLAAIHGRSLESKMQLAAEIAPVIGGAFLWRTAARTLVGLLPGIVSAAPKAAIAFAGTYVVGEAAHYYYRSGRRPNREMLEGYSRQALGKIREALPGR